LYADSDGIGGSASTAPEDWFIIVDEMEVIISPIDEWVNGGKPGFTKDQVVIGEGIGAITVGKVNRTSNRDKDWSNDDILCYYDTAI
jgi:hypothetical protein